MTEAIEDLEMRRAAQEYGGLIKHSAKLLFVYLHCIMSLVTNITRKSYEGSHERRRKTRSRRADLEFV